ncbi:MAG: class I SAM-dependent methyltransferase [Planctomycetes bacterium]|nr:class I SAM-dependent methyltransferase [Planctomycetota bacterium]
MSTPAEAALRPPSRPELEAVFRMRHGDPASSGRSPRLRWRHGYFTPDEHYEALVGRLVTRGTHWLDVGCGRELFPSNRALARELSARAEELVGLDPDPTLEENPYVHRKVRSAVEDFDGGGRFDLVTLRMVAEHVAEPERTVAALARAARPGGRVVVFTVNARSPVPLLTRLVPFRLRHPIKRFLWRTEAKDTFPTRFRMNTRARLRELFAAQRCREAWFVHLDDCRTFARFPPVLAFDLWFWRALRALRLHHPETCLLGVYERIA